MKSFIRAVSLCRLIALAIMCAAALQLEPVAPSAQAACVPVPSGLVSWWPLEADARDTAGANAGVVAGGALFATGEVTQGMVFDGVNDGVQVEPSASLNVGTGGGFTVELWMKPDAVNDLQPLIEWNNQGSIGTYLWYAGTGAGTLDGDLIDTAGVEHPLNVPAVWQHVAMTYDKASGLAVLYRKGTAVLQHNWGQMTPQTSWQFHLGSRGSYRFKGMMDEVSLFNRALSAAEIQSNYEAGSAGKCGPDLPPAIFAQPVSLTGFIGSNITFNVVAGGSLPLAY